MTSAAIVIDAVYRDDRGEMRHRVGVPTRRELIGLKTQFPMAGSVGFERSSTRRHIREGVTIPSELWTSSSAAQAAQSTDR